MTSDPQIAAIVALRADLLREADPVATCESCGAVLLDGDDFVSDPDGVSGCWTAMSDTPSRRTRPCYSYRVGKPSAVEPVPDISRLIKRISDVSAHLVLSLSEEWTVRLRGQEKSSRTLTELGLVEFERQIVHEHRLPHKRWGVVLRLTPLGLAVRDELRGGEGCGS